MRGVIRYILVVMSLLAFVGCDVHEFPVDQHKRVPFLLHLNFDRELPLYQEIPYTRSGEEVTKAPVVQHDFRYVIKAYRTDNVVGTNHVADTTFIFTKSELSELNYTAPLELKEGTYRLCVWCDYVDAGSREDKYYDTSNFDEVTLIDRDNHPGSNNFRDAFIGYATTKVVDPDYYTGPILNTINNQATAEMSRPMGKFEFISTDVDIFLSRVAATLQQQGILPVDAESDKLAYEQLRDAIDLGQFKVVFHYGYSMPRSYNIIDNKPADMWENISFVSRMERISTTEVRLGFDYVFVRDSGTTLSLAVEVYNDKDKLMSRSKSVAVPIMRSKLTTVKGEFLTSTASGGVTINPGYEDKDGDGLPDDHNWDITDAMQPLMIIE